MSEADSIEKLEELFKNGFILEDEYTTRKASLSDAPTPMDTASSPAPPVAVTEAEALPMLPEIIALVKAPANNGDLERNLTRLRKLLSIEKNPPIQEVLNYEILPHLREILNNDSMPVDITFETLWILTNIVSGNTEQANQVVQADILPLIIKNLSSPASSVCEQAIWALGNVAGDSIKSRDIVLAQNVISPLHTISNNSSFPTSIFRNLTWTLSNLCRGKPSPPFHLVEPLIEIFARMLQKKDAEVQIDALWGLSYLSDGPNNQIQKVIEAGVLPDILELLGSTLANIVTPALRIVGNVVTGDDLQTQLLLNYGVLSRLHNLLSNPKKGILKETCWTISNITAGNRIQIQTVLDGGIMNILSEILQSNKDYDIKKEALWAIANATSGASGEQMHTMVDQIGIVPGIVSMLSSSDERLLSVALEGLENIMKVASNEKIQNDQQKHSFEEVLDQADGMDYLESLADHESHSISVKANSILSMINNN